MYSFYLFLPIISFFITFFLGRFLGKYLTFQIHISALFISFCIVSFCFYEVVLNSISCEIIFFKWFSLLSYDVNIGFIFDSLSVTVSLIVIFISLLVHFFSVEYMWGDPYFMKFFSFLTLFTFFMLFMIVSPNFVQFFLGWEGVGICSYLLINFWSTRPEANRSALKAVILNKFGDIALYSAFILLFLIFRTFDFYSLNFLINNSLNFDFFILSNSVINNVFSLDLICILLFIACIGKSAQIGLHVWLPDAMEGPTPVSALLHAATMVTAGIYLVLRCSYIFQLSEFTLSLMSWTGLLTMLVASIIAIGQNDLKKIIAYSTCSHLGYMVIACGSSFYNLALFHMFNHAFFKALLFIAAGSLIHMTSSQDLRNYSNIQLKAPVTYVIFLIGSISSISFIGSSGYYSKDLIIEHLALLNNSNEIFYGLFDFVVLVSTILSVAYSVKLLFLGFDLMRKGANSWPWIHNYKEKNFFYTFHVPYRKFRSWRWFYLFGRRRKQKPYRLKETRIKDIHASESSDWTLLPLSVLAFFSLFGGFIFLNLFTTLKFFQNQLYTDEKYYTYNLEILFNNSFIELPIMFSLLSIFLIVSFYYLFNFFSFKNFYFVNFIKKLQINKFYFNLIYVYTFIKIFMNFSFNIFFKFLDRGVLDLISPLGLVRRLNELSNNINLLQNGSVQYYIFSLIFFFLIAIFVGIFIILNLLHIFIINLFVFFLTLMLFKNG